MSGEAIPLVRTVAAGKITSQPPRNFFYRHEPLVIGAIAVVLAVAIWEGLWLAGLINPLFGTGPSAIAKRLCITLDDGTLVENLFYSGKNFLGGFALAVTAGVALGIPIGWYRKLRYVANPFVDALYATPRIALIPLIMIWFGAGVSSKIVIIFLSGLFPVLVNTIAGMQTLDRDLLRAARSFCASDRNVFRTIALPGAVPFVLAGVRQGVAHALIGVVVGEVLAGSAEGVGFMIQYSGNLLNMDALFLYVTVVAGAGILLTSLVGRLQMRFERWRPLN
jgi:NitT/TauT family transport system permease protein